MRVVVFLTVLLLPPAAVAAQGLEFPALPADAPAGTGRVEACTAPGLVGSARCGVYRVWEGRERREGRTVDIAFVVLEALEPSERAEDPVVLLPGGPGQAFIPGAVRISRGFDALRRTRDVLLVDVRGVGRSQALDCGMPYPGGLRSRFGALFPLDHIAACRDTLAGRASLEEYTTASSVDDVDELRAWLGYQRVNLSGGSYGTRVAQVYMRRHPGSVRTVVLNGVTPVSEPGYVHHARLLQRTLDGVVAACAADAECSARHLRLGKDVAAMLARFRAAPVEVELRGERVPFHLADLAYALRGLLYGRADELPALIQGAAAGDVLPLAEYYVERTGWVGEPGGVTGYHLSVLCAEDIDLVTDELAREATAGTFMGSALIDSYRAACAIWPHARLPAAHFEPVTRDIPTLLLSGSLDPVTPPEGAETVARHLPDALHVVVPGGGHGVGGPCIERMVVELIESGSLEGVDTSCVGGSE
ncbi:MAG TPA: alpha/beta fold hydrolase [Longimicrobiales bacterium]|nr:alpha/beta fold hydrolase [Longimicrobiales bacterium]